MKKQDYTAPSIDICLICAQDAILSSGGIVDDWDDYEKENEIY